MGINYWDSAYQSGHIPWDPGSYDGHLPGLIEKEGIAPCRAVDIGCGTGKSLVWLAERGFSCTGIEIAPTALRMAKELAERRQVSCDWLYGAFPGDFDSDSLEDGSFELAMDRGVFHLHTGKGEQRRFVEGVSRVLVPGGIWYSLLASSADGGGYGGPPRWSRGEVVAAVKPHFEVVHVQQSVFTPGEEGSMAAWVCVLRNRRAA